MDKKPDQKPDKKPANRPTRSPAGSPTGYVGIAVLTLLLLAASWFGSQSVDTVSYSEFQALLSGGRLREITVSSDTIRARLADGDPDGREWVQTTRVDPDLADKLAEYDVEFRGVAENTFFTNILSLILPFLLIIGVWMFFIRRLGDRQGMGGLMAVGKSKAKIYVETNTQVTFADVAGVDEAEQELQEIVAFLKTPQDYSRLGAHVPKGVLLLGPPGTGKTLLARAVAGEAGVPFFSISGSEFVEMFVGVGAARVRDLFEQARNRAPCIIFIDELDALGRARGAGGVFGGHDEKEQTLNQLLGELDGFDPHQGIVLLAATNRPEILDPALLRAGRFDRQVLVDRPDKRGRVQILAVHIKKIVMDARVDLEQVAALTAGFSGADLANLVNEAATLATRRKAAAVTLDDFTGAIERIVAGLEKKNRILSEAERRTVAYHESGHALVRLALPGVETVHKISIIPRGVGALGYNIQRPTEDRYLMTRQELEDKMAVLLGGRAAEVAVFGTLSTGASDDLDKATEIARSMITRYGMDQTLGLATYSDQSSPFLARDGVPQLHPRNYSEQTAREIDEAVRAMIQQAFDKASAILSRNRDQLTETAEKLLLQETLTADELPTPVWDEPETPAS